VVDALRMGEGREDAGMRRSSTTALESSEGASAPSETFPNEIAGRARPDEMEGAGMRT
jgi:hypothetical protein